MKKLIIKLLEESNLQEEEYQYLYELLKALISDMKAK